MALSVREYVAKIRMEKAKELLKHTNLDIIDIAFSVGYNDSNYFSRVFRKMERLTPKEYRKKSMNNTNIVEGRVPK